MLTKRNVLLLVLLFFSKISLAFLYNPPPQVAKFNSTKSHYYISFQAVDKDHPGYTAVYEATTNKLKYKIEKDVCRNKVLLSADGERFTLFENTLDTAGTLCFISIYDSNGLKISESFTTHESGVCIGITDDKNTVSLYFIKSTYTFYTANWKMKLSANDPDDFSVPEFEKDYDISDSLFNIAYLKFNGLTLKEHLLKDLNKKEFSYLECSEIITISLILDSTGAIVELEVLSYLRVKKENGESTNSLHLESTQTEKEVIKLIREYALDKANLHDGANFWLYSGGLYI